jgi:hypothetical protein
LSRGGLTLCERITRGYPDGSLVLIELKRNRTPREVVSQAIDYATFVEKLKAEDIATIYAEFAPGRDLAADFQKRFGQPLDEETLNESHQIVIVAAAIDESTARIVSYLNEREIAINVLCFQVFALGQEQLQSRVAAGSYSDPSEYCHS